MDITKTGNLWEAALWILVSIVLAIKASRSRHPARSIGLRLSPVFLLFGLTDLVEMHSGAWWKPSWLLLLKGACVICFLAGAARFYRISRRDTVGPG